MKEYKDIQKQAPTKMGTLIKIFNYSDWHKKTGPYNLQNNFANMHKKSSKKLIKSQKSIHPLKLHPPQHKDYFNVMFFFFLFFFLEKTI